MAHSRLKRTWARLLGARMLVDKCSCDCPRHLRFAHYGNRPFLEVSSLDTLWGSIGCLSWALTKRRWLQGNCKTAVGDANLRRQNLILIRRDFESSACL